MATLIPETADSTSNPNIATAYKATSTASGDVLTIPILGCKTISIHAVGIDQDTLVSTVTNEVDTFNSQIPVLDKAGLNPFIAPEADTLQKSEVANSQLRITRTGVVDGTILFYINVSE